MPTLTQKEVENLALSVGFKVRGARIASAIALCETPVFDAKPPRSDFGLIGDQDLATDIWGYSYGGFQIRSLREQKGTGATRDETRLLSQRPDLEATVGVAPDVGGKVRGPRSDRSRIEAAWHRNTGCLA